MTHSKFDGPDPLADAPIMTRVAAFDEARKAEAARGDGPRIPVWRRGSCVPPPDDEADDPADDDNQTGERQAEP